MVAKQTRDIAEVTTLEQRLAISLDLRDFTNQMRETLTRIERMLGAFSGMVASELGALAAVLTVGELAELTAMANLATLFVVDVQAAAPTFLPAPTAPAALP